MSEQNDLSREQKNQVFGVPSVIAPPSVSQASSLNVEIPVDAIPLPSRGLVYPKDSSLHLQEMIEFKQMTTREEDILMNRAFIKKGTVITELIKSCLTNPKINVNDMLSGDRNALLVAIRITGYGAEYTTTIKCPSCELSQEFSFNLAELELKRLELNPVAIGENRFVFTLPQSKHDIQFKFLTGKDEEEILKTTENRKKTGVQEATITTRLMTSILSVNGESDKAKLVRYVQNLRAGDSRALRTFIDTNEPGMDMKQLFVCKGCDHEEVVTVPIGPSFLWPST